MDHGRLLTWMHSCNCIGYTFSSSSITHKLYAQIKSHNDGATKVVTPHLDKWKILTPYL